MAIRPPAPLTPEPRVRVSLGKVQVTIDDLQALLNLLREHELVTEPVVVTCDEGTFDEAADMRLLSDRALTNLRVETRGVTVHLLPTLAQAYGPPELTKHIERAWARTRQTKEFPSRGKRIERRISNIAGLLMFAFAFLGPVSYAVTPDSEKSVGAFVLFVIVALILGAVVLGLIVIPDLRTNQRTSWAVVHPLTLEELRRDRSSKTSIPLWSLLVAVAALLASITFNIIQLAQK